MIVYVKFFNMLADKKISPSDLYKLCNIHPTTIAKMKKGQTIKTDSINKICEYFKCQPSDIMNYIDD